MNKKSEFKLKESILALKKYKSSQLFFLTLTCPDEETWGDGGRKALQSFHTNIMARKGIKYIKVKELHQSGQCHFHYILVLPWETEGEVISPGQIGNKAPQRIVEKHYRGDLKKLSANLRKRLPNYGFGRFNFTPVQSLEALANYLTKAIGGCLEKRARRWSCSKGLRAIKGPIAWVGGRAANFRRSMAYASSQYDCFSPEAMRQKFGRHWFLRIRNDAIQIADELNQNVMTRFHQILRGIILLDMKGAA